MKLFKDYINIIFVTLMVIVLLRVIEVIFISYSFEYSFSLIIFEIIGLLLDIIVIGFFLYLWHFVYNLIYQKYIKIANITFLIGIIVFNILHLTVLKYFLYQLRPLDINLYSHSLRESLFSYKTSNTDYSDMLLMSIFISAIVIILFQFIKKRTISDKETKIIKAILISTVVLFPIFEIFGVFNYNNFTINKSYFFYKRSIGYAFKKQKHKFIKYDNKTIKQYQKTFNNKKYLSLEYPLLHKFENSDVLGDFFTTKETSPNIVFIIVEGMSDELIHEYKGIKFMTFMDSLSQNSLYWDNFFTLGERSFAVVPSITGSLPYGVKGFTLLDKMPYHFSLVNILKKNGYYCIYFDSQDAWFHDKDKYFKFNNLDRVFDKNDFSSKFEKIRVGNKKYFWGYTDKDLFNQALITMDTIQKEKRIEVYFTGTMHSPFVIKEQKKYENLFKHRINEISNKQIREHFEVYKKQLLSIMYTNDAIKDFIESYKQKKEYKNTIFIITGDHPMTEIPPEDGVKKYHVPLIIHSALLRTKKVFKGVSSHLDVYESLLSFLNTNYNIEIPKYSTSIGYKLDTSTNIKYNRLYAFMNDNREIVDFYSKGNFLSNDNYTFKVKDKFKIYELKNRDIKTKLSNELEIFNNINNYVTEKNKLLPEKYYMDFFDYKPVYFHNDTTCVEFNDKYSYIVVNVPIENNSMYIDISLDFIPKASEKTSIYCTLKNRDGELLYSSSFNLAHRLQNHIKIDQLNTYDTTVYLSVYIDNKTLKDKEYCNPTINVYSY